MSQRIKRLWNIVNGVLISLVLLLAVTLVGARFIGFHPYVVLSGSMEPAYKTGSIIYVKDASEELQKGDVITYQLNDNTVATHRIVEVIEESGEIAYRTKGDKRYRGWNPCKSRAGTWYTNLYNSISGISGDVSSDNLRPLCNHCSGRRIGAHGIFAGYDLRQRQ